MTQATGKRRGHGEDSIYWDASRNRFIGAVDLGFGPDGTRIRKKVSGKTKVEVRDKLRDLHKEMEAGLRPRRRYTVGDALEDWLAHGIDGLSERTVTLYRTVQIAHNVLVRAIRQAERDDLVGRNVAALADTPKGQLAGRPSKSLTLEQAVALMAAAKGTALEAIALLAGHNQTATAELVYRHQIVPALTRGAEVMDQIFG